MRIVQANGTESEDFSIVTQLIKERKSFVIADVTSIKLTKSLLTEELDKQEIIYNKYNKKLIIPILFGSSILCFFIVLSIEELFRFRNGEALLVFWCLFSLLSAYFLLRRFSQNLNDCKIITNLKDKIEVLFY